MLFGTAEPPTSRRFSALRSHRSGSASIAFSIAIHTVGTPAVSVTRSSASRSSTLSASRRGPGRTSAAPTMAGRVGDPPGVRVEHRDDRQDVSRVEMFIASGSAAPSSAARARGASRGRPWAGRSCPTCSRSPRPGARARAARSPAPRRRSTTRSRARRPATSPTCETTITCSKSWAERNASNAGSSDSSTTIARSPASPAMNPSSSGCRRGLSVWMTAPIARHAEVQLEVLGLVPQHRPHPVALADPELGERRGEPPRATRALPHRRPMDRARRAVARRPCGRPVSSSARSTTVVSDSG